MCDNLGGVQRRVTHRLLGAVAKRTPIAAKQMSLLTKRLCGQHLCCRELGRARQPCPGNSDVDFLRNLKGVVDLDAQISHRALDLRVAEEQLNRPQVAGALVDQGRLRSTHGMRRVFEQVETDAADPLGNEARILPGGQMLIRATAAREQALARLPVGDPQIVVQCLPRHLCQFEPNGPTCLPLADVGSIDGVAVGCYVIHSEGDEIAAAQFAVDGEVEQRQVARAALKLQLGSNGPYVSRSQWRLRTGELAFVPRWSIQPCI
jgi:hypothetical protein